MQGRRKTRVSSPREMVEKKKYAIAHDRTRTRVELEDEADGMERSPPLRSAPDWKSGMVQPRKEKRSVAKTSCPYQDLSGDARYYVTDE